MQRSGREPLAIVGMGALLPKARNVREFWANVVSGTPAVRPLPPDRWDRDFLADRKGEGVVYVDRGAFLDDGISVDVAKFGIMPNSTDSIEPDQLIALAVADMTFSDARRRCKLPEPERIGVILGKGGYIAPGQIRSANELRESRQLARLVAQIFPSVTPSDVDLLTRIYAEQAGRIDSEAAVGMISNMAASRIANRFDLRGPAYLVDGACASSLVALDHAMSVLTLGRVDMVLVGGVHHCHDVTLWRLFSQLGALSRSGVVRPFSEHADGTLLGEGTGMVAVKRLGDARRDGDDIYAAITGVGVSSDGRGVSVVHPSSLAQERAIADAWAEAQLDVSAAGSIGYVEGHGTATPVGDKAELTALRRMLTDDCSVGMVHLGSVKSLVGHTMAASGVVGLIKSVLAVSEAVIPIMPLCGEPSPMLAGSRISIPETSIPWEVDSGPRRAGLSSFGFGGVNVHVVIEEVDRVTRSKSASNILTVQRSARNPHRFAARTVNELDELLAGPTSELESVSQIDLDDMWPVRVCLSSLEPTLVRLARNALRGDTSLVQTSDLVVCREPFLESDRGRTAIVFPGLESPANSDISDIVNVIQYSVPDTSRSDVLEQARRAFWLARAVASSYRQAEFEWHDVMGASIGELAAAVETGRLREVDVDSVLTACDPVEFGIQPMPYAMIAASRECIRDLLDDDAIWITHENSPTQTLVCGEQAHLRSFLSRLRRHGIAGEILHVASGFHTPLLAPSVKYTEKLLADHGMAGSHVRLWSATTAGRIHQNSDIRYIARSLTEEVHLRSTIEAMWADGVRGFVQFGEGTVPAMIDETLRGRPHLALSALVSRRSAMAQLRWVSGSLWAAGARIRTPDIETSSGSSGVIRIGAFDHAGDALHRPLSLGSPLIELDGDSVREIRRVVGGTSSLQDAHPYTQVSLKDDNDESGVETPSLPLVATRRIRVDLDTMPFVRDHQFFRQAPDWPKDEDRGPVLPATTTLWLMEQTVNDLVSVARMHVTTARSLTLLKWIQCAPGMDVDIEVRSDGDVYRVTFGQFASAVFEVSDSWPSCEKECQTQDLGHVWQPSATVMQRYRKHQLFHGPSFRTLIQIDRCWSFGVRGTMKWNGIPGSLLDAVGQLLGCWVQDCYRTNLRIMPIKVGRIDYFGPHPATGVTVTCVVSVRSVSATLVEADMELEVARRTWCRITGWQSRRFRDNADIQRASWWPDRAPLAMVHSGGWWSYSLEGEDFSTRQFILSNQFGSGERKMYELEPPADRRGWMLSRIAAKDAVRAVMWRRHRLRCFPAEIAITRGDGGRPVAVQTLSDKSIPLHISLAHSGCVGVALASGAPCGIHVECVKPRESSFWESVLSPAEIDVIRQLGVRTGFEQNLGYASLRCARIAVGDMIGAEPEGEFQDGYAISAEWNDERKVGRFVIRLASMQVPVLFTYDTWGVKSDMYVTAWTRRDWV